MKKKLVGKFAVAKPGRKWGYAEIKLRAPRGWQPYMEYGWGPSMRWDGTAITITVRREK